MVVVGVEVVGQSWLAVRDHFLFPALRAIVVVVVGGEGGGLWQRWACCMGPHPASCTGSNGGGDVGEGMGVDIMPAPPKIFWSIVIPYP